MALKTTLTNEQLNKRFDNPFVLVNYAIKLAKMRVQRGEGLDSNPANDVLDMLVKGEDIYDDEAEEALEEEEEAYEE
jgi:hypothetical protein